MIFSSDYTLPHEDVGNSYDVALTYQLQNATAPNENLSGESFHELYKIYWKSYIAPRVRNLDPNVNWYPYFDPITQTAYPPDIPDLMLLTIYLQILFWFGTKKLPITLTVAIQIWSISFL